MTKISAESWNSARAYEQYVGRWSRLVASHFLKWLAIPPGLAWVDAGCGTGALTSSILTLQSPVSVLSIDLSNNFVSLARESNRDPRAHYLVGDATRLPWKSAGCDAAVSGLVLNYVPDPDVFTREMMRVTKPGGWVAMYVWDYAGGMEMMRYFWDAAVGIRPKDMKYDQAERFPICQPGPLKTLFERNHLKSVTVQALVVPTTFRNFDDYWRPFLGKTGVAPGYLARLSDDEREGIRQILESRLAPVRDRPIELSAAAWAVRGTV